jgi:glycosyltransferase involved in cell wall biosynthesis
VAIMSFPKVSILLATYFPNEDYLTKQLISINNQTYPNLELLVCDDSDNEIEYKKVCELLNKQIYSVTFYIFKNNVNLGSNKTFERLTLEASGEFISYCDQDDIWEKDKIEKLVKETRKKKQLLIYSDLSIIDAEDMFTNSSFRKLNFRLKHVEGEGCFFRLVRRNSVTGCTMLINAGIAKKACPFPDNHIYPHDHWLAIYSSVKGSIGYVSEPLVRYRIHSSNQIGNKRFINIRSIEDYVKNRIQLQLEKYDLIEKNMNLNKQSAAELKEEKLMVKARGDFFQNKGIHSFVNLLKFIKNDPILILFEIILFSIPNRYSTRIINYLK